MSRILVTGGFGLLGRHLANHLAEKIHHVTVVDDLSNSWLGGVRYTEFIQLDVTKTSAQNTIAKCRPDVVFHLACHPYESLSQFTPADVSTSIVTGTINTLVGAINSGTCKRFVNLSSLARYGSGTALIWNKMASRDIVQHGRAVKAESGYLSYKSGAMPPFVDSSEDFWHIPAPEDIYGISKVHAERSVEVLCDLHGIEWCHAVPWNVYGPSNLRSLADPYRNVVSLWINALLRDKPIVIFGDGQQRRAPSYVGDVVPAIAKMGFLPEAAGQVINVGAERHMTIKEMAQATVAAWSEVAGARSTIWSGDSMAGAPDGIWDAVAEKLIRYESERPCEVKHAYCSVEKAKRLLGYEDKTPLREGIKKTIEWALELAPNGVEPRYLDHYEIEKKMPRVWQCS